MKRTMNRTSNGVGVSPTPSNKLVHTANQLGLPGIARMQGTTKIVVDTVLIADSANPQTLNFFVNTNNKSRNFSNLQNGTLKAGESLLIENIYFTRVELTGADLNADTTGVVANLPLVQNAIGESLALAQFDLEIANSTVIDDFPIIEQLPWINPLQASVTSYNPTTAGETYLGRSVIKTEAMPVIPPNQGFRVSLRVPPITGLPANSAIVCGLGRFGSLFSAKENL